MEYYSEVKRKKLVKHSPLLRASLVAQLVKESACNAGDPGSVPGMESYPWRRAWQPTPVFLPGESPWAEEHGRLHSPWGRKGSDMTERLSTHIGFILIEKTHK